MTTRQDHEPYECRALRIPSVAFHGRWLVRGPAAAIAAAGLLFGTLGPADAALIVKHWLAVSCVSIAVGERLDECREGAAVASASANTDPSRPGPAVSSVAALGAGASASQTPGGWNAASVFGDTDILAFDFTMAARARLELEVMNTGAAPIPFTFHFFITGGDLALQLWDFSVFDDKYAVAQVYAAFGGDPIGVQWAYQAELRGINSGIPIQFDEPPLGDPHGIGTPRTHFTDFMGASTSFGHVRLDPFLGKVPLPDLLPGASVSLSYEILAHVYTGLLEHGRSACRAGALGHEDGREQRGVGRAVR